jgi:hypothetical protein
MYYTGSGCRFIVGIFVPAFGKVHNGPAGSQGSTGMFIQK